MGVQIDITVANWMAALIEPEASIPVFPVTVAIPAVPSLPLTAEIVERVLDDLRRGE